MMKKELEYGWTLHLPNEKLSVLTSESGKVAVIYLGKAFGDLQPLFFELNEEGIDIVSLPHYVHSVQISIKKEISITLSDFLEQFEKNQS